MLFATLLQRHKDCEIVAGIDKNTEAADFPVYSDFNSIKEEADVIIDFSNPAPLNSLLEYSAAKKIPVVIATTGFDDDQKSRLKTPPRKTACSSPIT